MPSNYPEAIDQFTTKTDGVSVVAAADINNLQDAVVAIQTTLGPNPPPPPPPPLSDSIFHVTWKDDFVGARRPNWVLTGQGTCTQNAERGGSATLTTGNTTDDTAFLRFGGLGFAETSRSPEVQVFARLEDTTQVYAVLAGLYRDADNLLEVYYDAESTASNFRYRCRSGGVETTIDSNLPADTNDHNFWIRVEADGESVRFSIDGPHTEAAIDSNIPSGLLEPNLGLKTKEDAAKAMTVDVFSFMSRR
ncbi:MAG: hypothetical protein GX934_03010 [Burkholderiales bacterium]|nr:hypothetical protein [Burkholderiales bacterium]